MTNTKLILKLLSIDESLINIFIKPKQLEVLKKQLVGQRLTENEKRYERGKLRAERKSVGKSFYRFISPGKDLI